MDNDLLYGDKEGWWVYAIEDGYQLTWRSMPVLQYPKEWMGDIDMIWIVRDQIDLNTNFPIPIQSELEDWQQFIYGDCSKFWLNLYRGNKHDDYSIQVYGEKSFAEYEIYYRSWRVMGYEQIFDADGEEIIYLENMCGHIDQLNQA